MKRLLLLLPLLAVACGGEGEVDPPDDRPRPIIGGGTAGGAISGSFEIFLVDPIDDAAITGATVMLTAGSETTEQKTDAAGYAKLPVSAGPVIVHVFADSYVPTSYFGVNAAQLTIAPDPRLEIVTGIPPFVTITGRVLGLDLLDVGMRTAEVTAYGKFTRFIPQMGKNVAHEREGTLVDTFTLGFDPRAKGMVVRADSGGANSQKWIGLMPMVNTVANSQATQDVGVTNPIDVELEVRGEGGAELPRTRAGGYFLTPNDRQSIAMGETNGVTGKFKFPRLESTLASGKNYLFVERRSDIGDEYRYRAKAAGSATSLTLTLPDSLAMPVRDGRNYQLTPLPGATFHTIDVTHLQLGPVWQARIYSGENVSVPMPPAGHEDLYVGEVLIDIRAWSFGGVDANNTSNLALEAADDRAYSSRFSNVDL